MVQPSRFGYARQIALMFSASFVSACITTADLPRTIPSAAIEATPTEWPVQRTKPGAPEAAQVLWRDFFHDPRLRALIANALEHNRDIRAAVARVEESRAAFASSEADRSPQINLSGAGNISYLPPSLVGGSRPMAQRYDLSLSLVSYEVDFWGRLARLSDAAKARLVASEVATRSVRATLIAEVANAYYTKLDTEERIGLLKEAIIAREQSRDLIQKGFEMGAASKLDVLQADGLLQSARGELASLQAQLITVTNYQTFLTGPVKGELPPGYSLASQRLEANFSLSIPSEVLLKRPDVMAAEQRLVESRANVEAARAMFFPRIVLTSSLGFASGTLTSLLSSVAQTGLASLQPNISIPLLDGGRTDAQLAMAKAREDSAVADYERTIFAAFREIADLLASQYGLAGQKRAAAANWVIQRQRLEAAEARNKAGAASYLEVLEAMRDELAAAQQVTQLRRAELSTATMLYKALGGGDVPSRPD